MFTFWYFLFRTSTPIHIQNEDNSLNQKALEKYKDSGFLVFPPYRKVKCFTNIILSVFWDVTLCASSKNWRFGGT
jgi:hypothetical protein